MVLNESQKMFVQGMLARRFVVENEALALVNVVTGRGTSNKSDLDKIVKHVNDDIKRFSIEIKQQWCDITNKNYYVLISNLPSSSNNEVFHKYVHVYSAMERDFFKNILEEIISSDEKCIRRNTALNLTVASGSSQSQHWGPHHYNQVLLKFIQDGWLTALDEGKVFLGARAVAELEHVLVNDYKLDTCNLCSGVCVAGFVCDRCEIMVHVRCWKKFTQGRKGQGNKCQKCDSEMRQT